MFKTLFSSEIEAALIWWWCLSSSAKPVGAFIDPIGGVGNGSDIIGPFTLSTSFYETLIWFDESNKSAKMTNLFIFIFYKKI